MMARDDPSIQITNAGEPERNPDQIKTLSLVGAWDTMRGAAKQDFLQQRIPAKLKEAMAKRDKLKQPVLAVPGATG